MSGAASVPAGWYADPSQPAQQRYWDGAVWTEHTAPSSQPAAVARPPSVAQDFVADVPTEAGSKLWVAIAVGCAVLLMVLAAVAVPTFQSQRAQAKAAGVQSDLRNAAIEYESYYSMHGQYPTSVEEAGWQPNLSERLIGYLAPDGQAFCLEASTGDSWWSYDSTGIGVRPGRC